MEPWRHPESDGVRSMAETRDKSFVPRVLWSGRGDSRNLAFVTLSCAQTTKVETAQDKIACLPHRVVCDREVCVSALVRRGDERNAAQEASDLPAVKRPPEDWSRSLGQSWQRNRAEETHRLIRRRDRPLEIAAPIEARATRIESDSGECAAPQRPLPVLQPASACCSTPNTGSNNIPGARYRRSSE